MTFETVIVVIAFSGMALMQFIDCASYLFRLSGERIGLISLGYSAQVLFNHASRLLVMVTFPVIGLLVDSQATQSIILAGVISCGLTVALLSLILLFNEPMQRAGIWLIRLFFSKRIDGGTSELIDRGPRLSVDDSSKFKQRDVKILIIGLVVYSLYSFNLFSIPAVASVYPENRVFIVQLSPALNAVGTFLLAFFIDPTFSIAVDRAESPMRTLRNIVVARITANTLICLFFAYLLLANIV